MFMTKYSNRSKIYINICFDIIKLINVRHMVPVPRNVVNIGLVDKLPFSPTRSLKFLNKLNKCICSA